MEEGTTKQKFLIKNIRGITWGDRKGHQKDVEQKKGAKKKKKKLHQHRLQRYKGKFQTGKHLILTLFKVSG